MNSSVTILYFAALRERVGRSSENVPLDGALLVSDLVAARSAADPALRNAMAELKTVRVAVNQALATMETRVRPGDEIALFPPMTGG